MKLLASAESKERLENAINEYYYSNSYYLRLKDNKNYEIANKHIPYMSNEDVIKVSKNRWKWYIKEE